MTTTAAAPGNADQVRAWDGEEGDRWTEHEDRYNAASRRFDPYLFTAAGLVVGERVLDIGCGCGLSTRQAARFTKTGAVLGVDLSRRMIERARRRARAERLDNAAFEQADAQTYPFQPCASDVVISRFGAMFFADPVTAFGNLHAALAPRGRLALLTWQPLERNDWVHALRGALRLDRPLADPPPTAPGPFGLSDPAYVRYVLGAAGFRDLAVTAVNQSVCLGEDTVEALTFVRALGLTRGLLSGLDDPSTKLALDRLRQLVTNHVTADGVVFSASAWLITAGKL